MRPDASVANDDVRAIEDAFVAHWANFGLGPGGSYHDDGDLIWIEAPVPQLPYNAVIRTTLIDDIDDRILRVTSHFHLRNVNFLCLVHPNAQPVDLLAKLAAHGLGLVEPSTGMSMQLASWTENRTTASPKVDSPI